MAHMREPEVIRRSPIVIVRNLIAVEFAAAGLYLLAGMLAYYAQIWRGIIWLDDIMPFQVAQIAFIFGSEMLLVFYIFLMWWRQSLRITGDRIEDNHGVVFRRHTVIARSHIASAVFSQSILGKLTHYGTVILRDGRGAVLARLGSIPEPDKFVALIMGHGSDRPAPVMTPGEPKELAAADEHELLERKSTLRWDMAAGKVNRSLERAALKTVAAFLNGDGGHLVIGVGDDKKAVGLEHDYATLARKDADGFINHFGNLFNAALGPHLRHLVQLRPFTYGGKECMLVSVSASGRPAYMNDEGREEFFVRTGNSTTALKLLEATAYIEARWSKK